MFETTSAIQKSRKKKAPKPVPDHLIYEVVGGEPIYYKGYKEVLAGTKTYEELIMDSILQSWFKAQIVMLLGRLLDPEKYELTVGETGIHLGKNDNRGADFAIFSQEKLVLDEHYSTQPPLVIVEIDVKAEVGEGMSEVDYVIQKIKDYHQFGGKNVIWIFTKTQKVMVAPANASWLTTDWDVEFEVLDGIRVNLQKLVDRRPEFQRNGN